MTNTICMLVTNPATNDPRVRREAATLRKAGYCVVVVGLRISTEAEEEWLDECRVIRVTHPRLVLRRLLGLLRAKRAGVSPSSSPATDGQLKPSVDRQAQESASDRQQGNALGGRIWADLLNLATIVWLNVALARVALRERAAIYHCHDLDTLLAGWVAKLWTRAKLVYDFHELFTEQYEGGRRTELWKRALSTLERWLIKRVDLRLTVSDPLGQWLAQQYNLGEVITLKNVPHFQALRNPLPARTKEVAVLYHGFFLSDRGLEQLIESAQYLRHSRIILRGSGYLEASLRALVERLVLRSRVSFAEPVSPADLVEAAAEADIGVIPYLPVCLNHQFSSPNKLFEYMMAGLAVVGSDLPELRRIILGHQVGELCDPLDPRDIARAINEIAGNDNMLTQMKRNARLAAQTVYNWEHEGNALLKAYHALAVG
ncbi:MAG: glycosyltransferase family 4 protein [Nitrospiraceae bacterium]